MKVIIFLLLIIPYVSSAQYNLGLTTGNINGVGLAKLNPATTAYDLNKWDVHIVSISGYSDMDYSFFKELYEAGSLIANDEYKLNSYYNFLTQKQGFLKASAGGPGFLYQLNNHRVGFYTEALASYNYELDNDVPIIDRDEYFDAVLSSSITATSQALLWSAWGLHYSYRVEVTSDIKMAVGITPKYLIGYKGGLVALKSDQIMQRLTSDSIKVSIGDASVSLAGLEDDYSLGRLTEKNGDGWALDFGWSILIGDALDNYKWKIGMSILNYGHIQFNQKATVQRFTEDNFTYTSSAPGDQSILNIIDLVKQEIDEAFDATFVDNQFNVGLPTTWVTQINYGMQAPYYIQVIYMKGLKNNKRSINNPDYIAFIPRYESSQIAIQLPIILEDYHHIKAGISARLGPVIIGGEHLISSVLSSSPLEMGHYYIGLRLDSSMF